MENSIESVSGLALDLPSLWVSLLEDYKYLFFQISVLCGFSNIISENLFFFFPISVALIGA
jgi:hypothetical protein